MDKRPGWMGGECQNHNSKWKMLFWVEFTLRWVLPDSWPKQKDLVGESTKWMPPYSVLGSPHTNQVLWGWEIGMLHDWEFSNEIGIAPSKWDSRLPRLNHFLLISATDFGSLRSPNWIINVGTSVMTKQPLAMELWSQRVEWLGESNSVFWISLMGFGVWDFTPL